MRGYLVFGFKKMLGNETQGQILTSVPVFYLRGLSKEYKSSSIFPNRSSISFFASLMPSL